MELGSGKKMKSDKNLPFPLDSVEIEGSTNCA